MSADLGREIQDAGQAIGLLGANGALDPSWFSTAPQRLQSILSNSTQRAGVLDLLDQIVPPASTPGIPAGEKWHPLLPNKPNGNLYLTVASNGNVVVGMAGEVKGAAANGASFRVHLPMVAFGGNSVSEVAGTKDHPLDFIVRVPLNLVHSGTSIGLKAVQAEVHLAPVDSQYNLTVTLEGLDLDGSGPKDVRLDPSNLGAEATHVVLGLIHQTLLSAGPGGSDEVKATIAHLMPLFGLGNDGIPIFPFADLLHGPSALQTWLKQLLSAGKMKAWLDHLAALFGGASSNGSGSPDQPWLIPIGTIVDANSSFGIAVAADQQNQKLLVGLRLTLASAAATADARFDGSAWIVGIPLAGTGAASVLPSASLVVRSPRSDAAKLVQTGAFSADSMRCGIVWNGATLAPILELLNVNLAGTPYARIDLTNTDSVGSALVDAVKAKILAAIGNSPTAQHLLALVGLVPPAGDATWPGIDLATLLANPTRAIAAVHRAGFQPGHNWGVMLAEVAGLVNLAGNVSGQGTPDDPWRVSLTPPAVVALELAAWNAQTQPGGDPLLRIGLRLGADSPPWSGFWLAELLTFDLPANASANVALMGGQHFIFELAPVPDTPPYAGMTMSAKSIGIHMDWAPGSPLAMYSLIDTIAVTSFGVKKTIGSLRYPSSGVPPTDLPTLAAAFGITQAELENLLRIVLARAAYSWADMPGLAVCSLLGMQNGLPNMQADWPLLCDPGTPLPFDDPLGALRSWLSRVALNVSADGTPFLTPALDWLRAFLGDDLPIDPSGVLMPDPDLEGHGAYDDPWRIPIATTDQAPMEVLFWMEPSGPPPSWAASLAARINGAGAYESLLDAASGLAQFSAPLREAFAQTDITAVADSLSALDDYFTASDGVVPFTSQVPSDPGSTWTPGTALNCAHSQQPADASARTQILNTINSWVGAQPRVVLLVGPAFSDHTVWDALLQQAEAAKANSTSKDATFNLRVPGLDPLSVDISTVTAVADFYTADLQDNGTGDVASLSAQIGRLVARVQALRGAAPVIVAHSTAGIAARAFAQQSPSAVAGIITLGTPHSGSPLTPLIDPAVAEGLRFLQRAVPTLPAGAIADAVSHLCLALDGYLPVPKNAPAGTLPTTWPYPYGSFAVPSGSTDNVTVKALAIGGSLAGSLFDTVRSAFAAMAGAVAGAAPTHLGIGLLGRLHMPDAGVGDVSVDLTLRADVYRAGISPGAAAGPERTFTIGATLTGPTGWLVGAPNSYVELGSPLSGTRLRWAELGGQLTLTGGNNFTFTPFVRLHQAAFQSPTATLLQLADASTPAILGAVFNALSTPGLLPWAPAAKLLDALTALGLCVQPDPNGRVGLSADAFAAIQVDPRSYLAPRLLTAISSASDFLGLKPTSTPNEWAMTIGDGPLEIYVAHASDWKVGARVAAGQQLTFGLTAGAGFDLGLHVPSLTYDASVSFNVAATTLTYTAGAGFSLSAPPWLDPLALPPTPTALKAAALNAIPRLLLSGAVTAFFEGIFGPTFRMFPIDKLIGAPGATMGGSDALGSSSGPGIDSSKINSLLQMIGSAIGAPSPSGLNLPAGLQVTATGTDPVTISLSTTAAIGGVVGFALDANIDSLRHVTPDGSLTLTLPLPGTWGTIDVTFKIAPSGLILTLTPQGSPPIQLLPTFSGLGALAEGLGATLLTDALDALNTNTGASTFKSDAIAVATALQLFNVTFSAEQDNWKALLQGTYLGNVSNRAGLLDAIKIVLTDLGIPGTLAHTPGASTMSWTAPPSSVPVTFSFGWDASGPAFAVGVKDFRPVGGPLFLNAAAGIDGKLAITADLGIGFDLQPSLGIAATPQLAASYNGSSFDVDFYPLATDSTHPGGLDIGLVPPAVKTQGSALDDFILKWLVPVATNLLLKETGAGGKHAWPGGPTVQDLVNGSFVLDGAKPLLDKALGLAATLATNTSIDIGNFHVKLVKDGTRYGVNVSGFQDIPTDAVDFSLRFGEVMSSPPWFQNGGITLYLFDTAKPSPFAPAISVKGVGVGFTGNNGPLINTSFLRTGRIGGYLFFDIADLKHISVTNLGGGIEIDQFGIPLGQALGDSSSGSSNPVAASMLQSDGGSAGGDSHSVNPAVDLWASYISGTFTVKIQNGTGAIWIGIHQKFGPIYIDQVGLEITNGSKDVALLVDGSVQLAGFTVQADGLGIDMPLNALASPQKWSLDLQGLAVSYSNSGVSIAGGLLKVPGAVVEYDGMLSIEIAGKGFTAVGGYSRPTFQGDSYTSLFIFVSLPLVLGGPPFFFVTGLGGGAGINRRLLVPTDITQVPNFILVSAIDDSSFANNPMGALQQISTSIPARRGSYWFAAGIRFDTFVLIHSVAVVYVALDGGFEIGILGVSRMALPTEDVAIVSVELALKARFSSSEGILSIQAQLTDNSYLFSRACQLTGGFAFFVWFPKGQFVLTIGGYHPAFQKPPEFPDVPRLGFHWDMDIVVIKGENYFALTNSCVMAGGRLEASAHLGPLTAWFIAYADFLISWDPFHYDIAIGLSVGVALDFDVCFFVCGHVHIEISIGADLHIIGPPLHGEVTVHVLFFSATIPFGPDPNPKPNYIQDFGVFQNKYLSAGDPNGVVVGLRVTGGILPPDPPGAKPNPGTKDQPWQLAAEWSFATETRMPASSYTEFVHNVPSAAAGSAAIDLAAMDILDVVSNHNVTIFLGESNTRPATDPKNFDIQPVMGLFPEATWHWIDPEKMHAAARTIPALSGLTIVGKANPVGQSAPIPISTLVDDILMFSKPLPFFTQIQGNAAQIALGLQAAAVSASVAKAPSSKMLEAAGKLLSGSGFATQRAAAGFAPQGLSKLGTRSLKHFRSAPPVVAPLSTGWDMQAVGLPEPKKIYRVPPQGPVILRTPRLRSVLQKRPRPAVDSPASIRTTVLRVKGAADVPRMLPPIVPAVAGAKLQKLPAAKAPRPTHAAHAPRSLHHPETGILLGARHAAVFAEAAKQVLGEAGLTVPSGTTHIWEIPAGDAFTLSIAGRAAFRVVAMNRAGHVLSDVEGMPPAQSVALPANTTMIAVSCLGIPVQPAVPATTVPPPPPPAFGAISIAHAPAGAYPAAGWQVGNEFEQVGPSVVLGRGSGLKLTKTTAGSHKGQKVTQTMVRLSRAALDQDGVETRLPASAGVVVILLDGQDPSAAIAGDLAVAVDGAVLATPPIPVSGGRRRALLYDVKSLTDPKEPFFTVSVGSLSGWQVSAVAGLHGTAREWAARMHGNPPERLVPDGPLTPDGQIQVRLVPPRLTLPGDTPVGPNNSVLNPRSVK